MKTTITTPNANAPRLIPNRQILKRGATKGALTSLSLEGVRDTLSQIAAKQEAVDFDRSFEQLHIDFRDGRVTAQFLGPNGLEGEPMWVHENAFSQMASSSQSEELMPTRLARGLLETATKGDEGEKLATAMWAYWRRGNSKPRTFRTVNIKDPVTGKAVRCLRSQHSQGYASYDNLTFVQDLLDHSPDLSQMPVLDFSLSDMGMRLRFAMEPMDRIELNKPVKMLEAWDSEVGRRRVVLNSLIWKLICTNGMAHWDRNMEFAWRHYGNADRIGQGVESAINEIQTASSGAIQAYDAALDISINNAMAWLDAELSGMGATQGQIQRSQIALSDPTTTPGGSLASAVDAVGLIAQDYGLFEQATLEQMAGQLLNRGREQALQNGGRILVEA
jgi:hypothetical protein